MAHHTGTTETSRAIRKEVERGAAYLRRFAPGNSSVPAWYVPPTAVAVCVVVVAGIAISMSNSVDCPSVVEARRTLAPAPSIQCECGVLRLGHGDEAVGFTVYVPAAVYTRGRRAGGILRGAVGKLSRAIPKVNVPPGLLPVVMLLEASAFAEVAGRSDFPVG